MKTFSRIYLFSKYGDWTGSQEGPEKKQCIIIIIKHWDSKSLETGFIRQCFNLTCKRVALCSCESRLSDDDQQRCCSQYRSCLADPGRRVQKYFLGLILLFKSCFLHWVAVTKLPKNFLFSKEEQQELQCRKKKELNKWINHEIEIFFEAFPQLEHTDHHLPVSPHSSSWLSETSCDWSLEHCWPATNARIILRTHH